MLYSSRSNDRKALVFVDTADIIMAVGTPKTQNEEKAEQFEGLTDFVRFQRENMAVPGSAIAQNRRGDYPAIATGVSYGGGQTVGTVLIFP